MFVTKWTALASVFSILAVPAFATPEAVMVIEDHYIRSNDTSFTVKRVTNKYPGSYYEKFVTEEILEVSIWDGRVLDRCLVQETHHFDELADGNWQAETVQGDEGCQAKKDQIETQKTPLNLETENGEVYIGRSVVLSRAFLQERLINMTAEEKNLCATTNMGCGFGDWTEAIWVDWIVRKNDSHVFLQVQFGDAEEGEDQAKILIPLQHKYWDPIVIANPEE